MARRHADSLDEQARYAKGAFKEIVPPDYFALSKEEKIFFDNVIDELPRADWTAHKIDMACSIAQYMGAEADLHRAFRNGKNKLGIGITPAQSSAITAAKGVAGIIASYRRSLGMQSDTRSLADNSRRRNLAKNAERSAKRSADEDEDDLLGNDSTEGLA